MSLIIAPVAADGLITADARKTTHTTLAARQHREEAILMNADEPMKMIKAFAQCHGASHTFNRFGATVKEIAPNNYYDSYWRTAAMIQINGLQNLRK